MPLIKKAGTTKGIDAAPLTQDEGDTNLLGAPAAEGKQPAAPTMQPGVVLQARYAIEGTLGVGGMSVVYRGRDLRFKDVVRPCAIKE
ncbi:MAG TPA: protein kinase, partial [Roseiflexaceae bacterium]